jgi:hypothetical protein
MLSARRYQFGILGGGGHEFLYIKALEVKIDMIKCWDWDIYISFKDNYNNQRLKRNKCNREGVTYGCSIDSIIYVPNLEGPIIESYGVKQSATYSRSIMIFDKVMYI